MIKKWSMSHPAVNGTEQRRAYVYLPTMYEAQPERRFSVLYMFDGPSISKITLSIMAVCSFHRKAGLCPAKVLCAPIVS